MDAYNFWRQIFWIHFKTKKGKIFNKNARECKQQILSGWPTLATPLNHTSSEDFVLLYLFVSSICVFWNKQLSIIGCNNPQIVHLLHPLTLNLNLAWILKSSDFFLLLLMALVMIEFWHFLAAFFLALYYKFSAKNLPPQCFILSDLHPEKEENNQP